MASVPGIVTFEGGVTDPEEDTREGDGIPQVVQFATTRKETVDPTKPDDLAPVEDPSLARKAGHVAAGFGQAFTDVADLPHNLANLLIPLRDWGKEVTASIFGEDVAEFADSINPSSMIVEELSKTRKFTETDIGGAVKETIAPELVTAEQAPVADAFRTGIEWAAGGVARGGVKLGEKLLRKGGETFSDIMRNIAPDLIIGTGAATGSAVAGDTGEVIGGVAAIPIALLRGKVTAASLDNSSNEAIDFIDKNAKNPEVARTNIAAALERGERGTLADLSGDEGLFDVQKALTQNDPRGIGRAIATEVFERDKQVASDVGKAFGDDVSDAVAVSGDAARNRSERALDLRLQRRGRDLSKAELRATADLDASFKDQEAAAAAAQRAADEVGPAETAIATVQRPAASSRNLEGSLDELEVTLREEVVNPAWEAFKQGAPVKTVQMRKNMAVVLKGDEKGRISKAVLAEMQEGEVGRVFKRIEEWDATVSPIDIQGELSRLKSINRTASNKGEFSDVNEGISRVVDTMDNSLRKQNKNYKLAVEATKSKIARTMDGKIATARLANEPETFAQRLKLTGDDGAASARLIAQADSPAVYAALQQRLRSQVQFDDVLDEKFMQKHADILNMPEMQDLQKQFQLVVDNRKAREVAGELSTEVKKGEEAFRKDVLKDIQSTRDAAEKRIDTLNKNQTKTLTNKYAANPIPTLKELMTPKNVGKLKGLYESVSKGGGQQAFRQHVKQELLGRVMKRDPGTGEVVNVDPNALLDYIGRGNQPGMKDIMVESGILDKGLADNIQVMLGRSTGSSQLRKDAIGKIWDKKGHKWDALISSGVAAGIMKVLPIRQSLILAGAVRRTVKEMLAARDLTPQTLEKLEQFTMNPEKFLEAAADAKTAEQALNSIVKQLSTPAVVSGQILAGE